MSWKATSAKVGRRVVWANAELNLLRIGATGAGCPAPVMFKSLPKAESRRLRRALHASGHRDLAATRVPEGVAALSVLFKVSTGARK